MVAPQPFFRARGTPFSVLHRIRGLLNLGHSVDLVTYPFGEPVPLEGLNIVRSAKPPLINDISIGPSIPKLFLDIPLYWATRTQLGMKSYDVIHSHEEAAFFCVGLAKRRRIKHIYDMHSSLPQQLKNFGRYNFPLLRKVFCKLENYVLRNCDGVITICTDLANVVNEFDLSVPHSMIENTGDDTLIFPATEIDVVEAHSLQGKEIVLYTGTFESYQGLDLLVEAFKDVVARRPRAHLLLVGGRTEQIAAMQEKVRGLGIEAAVSFTGMVPSSEIPSYLKCADVIASPRSSGTNTPLKLYGYIRSGVPLVATDKYTHTQTLGPEYSHLVPATAGGLADGLVTILSDRGYAERLAAKAQEVARRSYSDEVYLSKVAQFYADVIGTAYGPAEVSGSRSHA